MKAGDEVGTPVDDDGLETVVKGWVLIKAIMRKRPKVCTLYMKKAKGGPVLECFGDYLDFRWAHDGTRLDLNANDAATAFVKAREYKAKYKRG